MAIVHHRRLMNTHGSRKFAVITGASSGIGFAFKALMAGDDKVVAGSVKNLLQTAAARVAPEQFKAARHAAQTKPHDLDKKE
jgi:NAD(P)-dependent dehydrogenase (short-subunit alcohol dehydrogenase family)